MKTTHLPSEPTCRNCGTIVDAATNSAVAIPTPGDISVCGYCGTLSKFTQDLGLEPLDADELRDIQKNHPESWAELTRIRDIVSLMINDRGRGFNEI